MTKRQAFTAGQQITVESYPFVRTVYNGYAADIGEYQDEGWRPGCDRDRSPADGIDDHTADGLGAMLIQVVEVVRLPGGFAPRVFYVRQWRDPDGKVFGKRRCRVTTTSALAKTIKGYRHEFYLDGDLIHPIVGLISMQGGAPE